MSGYRFGLTTPGSRPRLPRLQVAGNDDGIILDHNLEQGSPADAPQLAPAVQRIINRTRRLTGQRAAFRESSSRSVCCWPSSGAPSLPR